ncbi:MAG: GNAT family N-acetyltransferase [Microbacteriaceae bacterium]
MNLIVRPALPSDAEGVAQVHVQAWQETYGYVLPQEQLDAMVAADRVERWREILNGSDGQRAWVALNADEQVIGWVTFGACRDEDRPGLDELYGIYTIAPMHGQGAGQALLEAGIGDDETSLWVMSGNDRAIRFYERNGFVLDGTVQDDEIWGIPIKELRMVRPAQ